MLSFILVCAKNKVIEVDTYSGVKFMGGTGEALNIMKVFFSKFALGFEFLTFKREKERLKRDFSCNKNGDSNINSGL